MPFDGAGVFQRLRNWVADAAAGIKIRADLHDSEDDNFAAGLSNTITRDGQSTITQNIPWNNKRITSLADPVNNQDAATKKYTDDKTNAAMPKTGGTFTGDITIEKQNPALILNSKPPADSTNLIRGRKDGLDRWSTHQGDATPEAGANVGSDFQLNAYADDGAFLHGVLFGKRSTGLLTVKGDPTSALGIATKQYAEAAGVAGANNRVLRAGDTMTGALISAPSAAISSAGAVGSFEVRGAGHAALTFYTPGVSLVNFGLAADHNFYMGGGSHGAVAYKFWTTRDFASPPSAGVTDVRMVHIADWNVNADGTLNEPYNGGIMTGGMWVSGTQSGGGAFFWPLKYRFRSLQLYIAGSWYTVAYG